MVSAANKAAAGKAGATTQRRNPNSNQGNQRGGGGRSGGKADHGGQTEKTAVVEAGEADVPVEFNVQALEAANAAHNATLDTDPVDPAKVVGMAAGDKSMIFQRERQILDTKLDGEAAQPVRFSHLIWGDNVRTAETLRLPEMIHSLKTRGYNPKYPIVVSKKSGNKFLVLAGNRRTEALKQIAELEPEIFKIILPNGTLPALVFEDLTEEEEILLRNDHSDQEDRVPLDDEGLFYSVKQLVKAGYSSQADIAAKLNQFVKDATTGEPVPNRSFIQQRVNLARLPKFVQDEYVKFMRGGKTASHVRWSMVAGLFTNYMNERKEGYVNGDGPKFKAAWAKAIKGKTQTTAGEGGEGGEGEGEGTGRVLNKTKIESIAQGLGSRLGQLFLGKIAGHPIKDTTTGKPLEFGDLDGQLVQAEQALETLNDIALYMGEAKFTHMMAQITKKKQAEAREQEKAAAATAAATEPAAE